MVLRPIYRCGDGYREEGGERCVLLLDPARRLHLSRLLSAILRHVPHEAGLRLGGGGWVRVEELVRAVRERWRNREAYAWLRPEHVVAVATLDPKGRFELRDGMIRARYGHSVPVEIEYEEAVGVERLFHGTTLDRLASIASTGLRPMKRLYVHLSASVEDACRNASRRRGVPIYLAVDPACLVKKGIRIYRASELVYLTLHVPPECITGSSPCASQGKRAKARRGYTE